jgi:hypothetical protein
MYDVLLVYLTLMYSDQVESSVKLFLELDEPDTLVTGSSVKLISDLP